MGVKSSYNWIDLSGGGACVLCHNCTKIRCLLIPHIRNNGITQFPAKEIMACLSNEQTSVENSLNTTTKDGLAYKTVFCSPHEALRTREKLTYLGHHLGCRFHHGNPFSAFQDGYPQTFLCSCFNNLSWENLSHTKECSSLIIHNGLNRVFWVVVGNLIESCNGQS